MNSIFDAAGRSARHVRALLCGVFLGGFAAASSGATPDPARTDAARPSTASSQRYFTTGLFYAHPDDARGVDSGLGVSYSYGLRQSATRAWELRAMAATLESGVAGATDFYQYGAGIDLVQHLGRAAGGHPYVLIGAGAVHNDVVPDDEDGVSAHGDLALGWRGAPWRRWGVRPRAELRGVYDAFQSGQVDLLFGVALEIGPSRDRVVEKVVEKVVERVVEVEKIVERPAAPPPDRDGDGIADAYDACPDTVAGAKVQGDGCVREAQVVVLPNVEFVTASDALTVLGREQLAAVVRFLRDQPELGLDIWGHTDAQGGDAYNQDLSERRAASVVRHLTGHGIAADRLTSAGFGESKPIASNEDPEGRARNRRVELNIRTRTGAGEQ